jgi:hypothetical protein
MDNTGLRIGIISMTDEKYKPVVELTIHVNAQYAQYHGYIFGIKQREKESWAETVWEKIPILREYLSQFDWLMWIDADAMVMDHRVKIEDLIEKAGEEKDLIISADLNGLNAGVFLLRNCEWSHQYLKHVDEHKPNYIGLKYPEQMAMDACIPYGTNLQHVAYLPQWLLNQFWIQWIPGDFIIHHSGGSVEDKVKGLTPFLEKVQYVTK